MKRPEPGDGPLGSGAHCYTEMERYLHYYDPARALGVGRLALFVLPLQLCFSHPDPREIARKAVGLAKERLNVYLHIHLHDLPEGESRKHRGSKESMRVAIGLFSDIDARGPGRSKSAEILCPTEDDAVWVAEECGRRHGVRPSYIITSGHGCYPAILFREPLVIAGPEDLERVESRARRYNNALHAVACERGWKGSVEYCGHAKVLRLPGTANWKDPQDPRPVCLTRETAARFTLQELDEALPAAGAQNIFHVGVPEIVNTRPDRGSAARESHAAVEAFALTGADERSDFLSPLVTVLQGNDPSFTALWNYERGFPSCSEYDMALAALGVSLGLEDQQIADLLIENRRRYPRNKQDRKGAHYTSYLRRTIAKARASHTEEQAWVDDEMAGDETEETQIGAAEPGAPERETEPAEPASEQCNSAAEVGSTAENNQEQATHIPTREEGNRAQHAQYAPPNPKDGIIKRLADQLMAKHHFARDIGERLYVHKGGLYVPGNLWVREQVQTILERTRKSGAWSSHRGREVVQYIMLRAPQLWEQPPCDEVNLKNGILNIGTGELRPHDPQFLSPIQIPVAYDPGAKCPAWENFVKEVFPADSWELAWEIVGDLITPDRSIQKAILLTGEGGNGKGVFLAACLALVGLQNVSSVPLHKLEEDRFSASRLYGKLVNCCADLSSAHLKSTSMFKSLTGGDVITGERKYENSFEFKPYVRLLFSANHPPRSDDASKAFFDRWLIVPFDRSFRGTDRERPRGEMDAMLAEPKELSGVLNKALPALRRVRQSGRFTETATTRKALAEFQQVTDPLTVWLERETVTHPNASVPCASLLNAYNAENARHGRPPVTQTAFGAAVRRLRPGVDVKKRGPKGEQKDHYIGIGLKADTALSQGRG